MRRPKISEESIENIELALTLGADFEIAARYGGISPRTFYNWRDRADVLQAKLEEEEEIYEVYHAAKKQAKKEGIDPPDPPEAKIKLNKYDKLYLQFLQVIGTAGAVGAIAHLNYLYKAAPHNPNISQWILEKRYPSAFGAQPIETKTTMEVTGAGGGPIVSEDISNLTDTEKANRVQQLLLLARDRQTEEEKQKDEEETAVT